jgi:hypothetical protein
MTSEVDVIDLTDEWALAIHVGTDMCVSGAGIALLVAHGYWLRRPELRPNVEARRDEQGCCGRGSTGNTSAALHQHPRRRLFSGSATQMDAVTAAGRGRSPRFHPSDRTVPELPSEWIALPWRLRAPRRQRRIRCVVR